MRPPRSRTGLRPSGRSPAAEPARSGFTDSGLQVAFAPLEGELRAVIAVSGGADSMALMLLASHWARALASHPPQFLIATVDHGLRTESAAEAAFVAQAAARHGLAHVTLAWTGPKPRTGLPAAARQARYALLLGEARRIGAAAILTAHTESDQAETLLMRLARGSGLDGLSSMAAESDLGGVRLLRPLLGCDRQRLRDLLSALGERWIEDPTNENTAHERIRIRQAAPALEALGLAPRAIATTARRLQRAREAILHATRALARSASRIDAAGYAELDLEAFRAAPEEIALRLLSRAVLAVGGGNVVRLQRLEGALERLAGAAPRALTIGGCRIALAGRYLLVFREHGRQGMPRLTLEPGASALWDNRFEVASPGTERLSVEVRAPLATELRELADTGLWARGLPPREAARTAPAFFREGRLVAAPIHAGAHAASGLRARFRHASLEDFRPAALET